MPIPPCLRGVGQKSKAIAGIGGTYSLVLSVSVCVDVERMKYWPSHSAGRCLLYIGVYGFVQFQLLVKVFILID
jgi:hypothetical protein